MPERPIIFSGPMVRAILAGTKTQTRRVWKLPRGCSWYAGHGGEAAGMVQDDDGPAWWHVSEQRCPYGRPGDRLWVREAWRALRRFDSMMPPLDIEWRSMVAYEADTPTGDYRQAPHGRMGKLRPPIHMPRWASRITLEITGVRVERLQDVSAADCWAEGIEHSPDVDPVHEYSDLWRSIYGPGSWAANPWVWVVEFQRVDSEARQP